MSGPPCRILVLCTHNAVRSQLAEALFRHLGSPRLFVQSAGTQPAAVHPLTLRVLAEIGIDASQQRSKSVDQFLNVPFDFLITVCDSARDACPSLPNVARRVHWDLSDPALTPGSELDRLRAFRSTRDRIAQLVRDFLHAFSLERT